MIKIIENIIDDKIHDIHTAFIGRVVQINGNTAKVRSLTYSRNTDSYEEQTVVSAVIPLNVKLRQEEITYVTHVSYSENGGLSVETDTKQIIVSEDIAVDDIVYVGICERDISNAVKGIAAEPVRFHDMNDGVILKVLGGGANERV